jgi:hypothetical protein
LGRFMMAMNEHVTFRGSVMRFTVKQHFLAQCLKKAYNFNFYVLEVICIIS